MTPAVSGSRCGKQTNCTGKQLYQNHHKWVGMEEEWGRRDSHICHQR